MTIQRQTNVTATRPGFSPLDWAAHRQQAELAAMPPEKRAEAIARAREKAALRPNGYLAKHLEKLYGEE